MLAVNAAVLVGVFLHKIALPPYVPYIHLLVDYHYGFTKRALIGAIVALFTDKVPVWLVFALGRRDLAGDARPVRASCSAGTFGFDDAQLPLFVFIAGSPFFLKNFMHTLGHFDIYGCALTIVLLLIPARSVAYVLLAAAVLDRADPDPPHLRPDVCARRSPRSWCCAFYLVQGVTRQNVAVGIASLAAVGHPVPGRAVRGHGRRCPMTNSSRTCKAGWPIRRAPNLLQFGYIWYQPLSKEIADTWARMPSNILGMPVFALLIWLHTPLWRYFARLIGALASELHRADRDRRARPDQRRLCRHVRDRVRLFALDLELGGLHVPDAARREDAAGVEGRPADPPAG